VIRTREDMERSWKGNKGGKWNGGRKLSQGEVKIEEVELSSEMSRGIFICMKIWTWQGLESEFGSEARGAIYLWSSGAAASNYFWMRQLTSL